jgi:hypothetical protein
MDKKLENYISDKNKTINIYVIIVFFRSAQKLHNPNNPQNEHNHHTLANS